MSAKSLPRVAVRPSLREISPPRAASAEFDAWLHLGDSHEATIRFDSLIEALRVLSTA